MSAITSRPENGHACAAIDTAPATSATVGATYREILDAKLQQKFKELQKCPSFEYVHQNKGYENIFSYFSKSKIEVFGYGSLMNKASLGGTNNAAKKPTVKSEAVSTMKPVVAYGFKRLFNYKDQKGEINTEFPNEKAFLNLAPSKDIHSIINGVTIEVDGEDLKNLVDREVHYDLIPILVTSWDDTISEKPSIEVRIAYTFMATGKSKEGVVYPNNEIYPYRGYSKRVQEAARTYGEPFLKMFQDTTTLADGTTKICDWKETFDPPKKA